MARMSRRLDRGWCGGLGVVVVVMMGVVVGGCVRGGLADRPIGNRVDAGAFRGGGDGVERADGGVVGVIPPTGRREVASPPTLAVGESSDFGLGGWQARVRPSDEVYEPGEYAAGGAASGVALVGLTLDARVGQINGEPVFANAVLEPLDGALRVAAAEAANDRAWLRSASEIIAREVRTRVANTLILAEARSNLTPEQRAGLPTFLQRIRESLAADERGSVILADDQLRRREGVTIDQKVQQILDEELIRNELRTRVNASVVVPFELVRFEYERRFEEFNPPKRAVFRQIWVRVENEAEVGEVERGLAAGESFVAVANRPSNARWHRDEGRWARTFRGEFAETTFFENETLQGAIIGLAVGEIAGPVVIDLEPTRYVAWVYLESIEQPRVVTLADAQQGIYQQLVNAEREKAHERYFAELFARGSFTRMEEMAIRLVEIATERYRPQAMATFRATSGGS